MSSQWLRGWRYRRTYGRNGDHTRALTAAEARRPRVWREPPEESTDLYPGLVLWDQRVHGSITVGPSRLPVWAIIHAAVHEDWRAVEAGWKPTERYGFTADHLSEFLYHLLEARGELGRLLMVLADVDRRESEMTDRGPIAPPWWQQPDLRQRVVEQLRRCLAALAEDE